jgi:hypothetical protein
MHTPNTVCYYQLIMNMTFNVWADTSDLPIMRSFYALGARNAYIIANFSYLYFPLKIYSTSLFSGNAKFACHKWRQYFLTRLTSLMMEAVSAFETSVNFYQTTQRSTPENSNLYTRRRKKLRCHFLTCLRHPGALWYRRTMFSNWTLHLSCRQLLAQRDTPTLLRGSVNISTEMFSLHWAELQRIAAILRWLAFVSELWQQCWTPQGQTLEFLVDSVSGTRSGSTEAKGTLTLCSL